MFDLTTTSGIRDYAKSHPPSHAWVTYFARRFVEKFTNKNEDNGYALVEEIPIWKITFINTERRPDMVILNVLIGDKVVLVIECKINENEFDVGEDQLRGYMRDLECDYGVLMNLYHAYMFERGTDNKIRNIGTVNFEENQEHDLLIEFINNI